MSYSFSVPPVLKADVGAATAAECERQLADVIAPYGTQPTDEIREHLKAATDAASELASAVGLPSDLLRVTIGGHANPGHGPTEGWADEMITVSIYVHRPLPAA